jgi:outer membrane protein assembly factor BamB
MCETPHRTLFLGWLAVAGFAAPALTSRAGSQSSVAASYRGGPAHLGVYSGGGTTIAGMQWRFLTDGGVVSSPAVVGDRVYIGSGDGHLYALELRTGARLWSFFAGSPIASSPTVARGLVIFGGYDGQFFAVDARTGAAKWRVSTGPLVPFPWGHESGDRYTSSPTIVNDVAFFGAGDGYVYAVDVATGKQKWRGKTDGRIRTSPAVANGLVFVSSFDGRVYAFDFATGKERWRYDTEGVSLNSANYGFDRRSIQSSPAVSDGVVFVGARDGFVYAIGAADGKLRWRYDHKISWINSSPAVAGGVVYDGSSDAQFVQALDAASGKELWRTNVGSIAWSSPAVAGDQLYIGDGAGRLHIMDRRTGKDLALFRTGAGIFGSPVVAGGFVIFGSNDGGVYALRLSNMSPVRRAVYLDSTYIRADLGGRSAEIAAYLKNRGYAVIDAKTAGEFFGARVEDKEPSVVVFATDHVPSSLVAGPLRSSLFRRYLDAGGKIVWLGTPPLLWELDSATKFPGLNAFKWKAPSELLDIDHGTAIFDDRIVRSSPEGLAWGFPRQWRGSWGIDRAGVTALGTDDWGLAAGWVKSYGGPPGTGFVRVPGDDLLAIFLAAEYRPADR